MAKKNAPAKSIPTPSAEKPTVKAAVVEVKNDVKELACDMLKVMDLMTSQFGSDFTARAKALLERHTK